MKAAALAAALVLFAVLYVTVVQPKRVAADNSERRLAEMRAALDGVRANSAAAVPPPSHATPARLTAPAGGAAHLTGIVVSPGRRLAILDGRLVRPGDGTAYGVVGSIESDAVVIISPDGGTFTVPMARPRRRSGP